MPSMRPEKGQSLFDLASQELRDIWIGPVDSLLQDLTMADFRTGSGKEAKWFCPNHPETPYPREIRKQFKKISCGYCASRRLHPQLNSLSVKCPELAAQWHPTMNGDLTPDDVMVKSNKYVWWTCTCDDGDDHVWRAMVCSRAVSPLGCPFRSGKRVAYSTSLARLFPEIAAEWVWDMNEGLSPSDVSPGSTGKEFYWQCAALEEHKYRASAYDRVHGGKCSLCRGLAVDETNCLSTLRPDVAAKWHPTRNEPLTATQVTPRAGAKVWWLCPAGTTDEPHEWQAVIANRTGRGGQGKGSDCPYCSGRSWLPSQSLARQFPDIAAEWDSERNGGVTAYDVSPGSDMTVAWKCLVNPNHRWRTAVYNRKLGTGCPHCRLVRRSEKEIRVQFELATVLSVEFETGSVSAADRTMSVDILVSTPTGPIAIEYDGEWWHRAHVERDDKKSQALNAAGYRVLRLREVPLPCVNSEGRADVPVEQHWKAHEVAHKVLQNMALREWIGWEVVDSYGHPEGDLAAAQADEAIQSLREERAKLEAQEEERSDELMGRLN